MQAPFVALYAFSADPITYGHINIVERVVNTFGGCLVAIGRNPLKQYLFSLDERRQLVERALAHIPQVKVMAFDGMVVDFAWEQGAKVIVKGVRNAADMDYEQTLHHVGVSQQMGIDTHLLFADQRLAHVSSSVVKAMQAEQGFIQDYVPPVVKAALEARISGLLIIGITGSIATGKSTLAQAFLKEAERLPIAVHHLDLDKLAHELLEGKGIGEPMYRELCKNLGALLGEQIMVNGSPGRERIAEVIFEQPLLRQQFNFFLVQPMALMLRKKLKSMRGVVLLDGALLADLDLLHLCNYRCVLCDANEQLQMERMQSRGYSFSQARARLASQWSQAQKGDLIRSSIARQGFGQLWEYNAAENSTLSLSSILESCEEIKWLK